MIRNKFHLIWFVMIPFIVTTCVWIGYIANQKMVENSMKSAIKALEEKQDKIIINQNQMMEFLKK